MNITLAYITLSFLSLVLGIILYDMLRTQRDISTQLKIMNEYANLSLAYRDTAIAEDYIQEEALPTGLYKITQDDIDEFFVDYEKLIKDELRNPYGGVDVRGLEEREV